MIIKIEIDLTEELIEFLRNLIVNEDNSFTFDTDDYDMYFDLLDKGIISIYESNYGDYEVKVLTEIGLLIKKQLNYIKI